MIALKIIRKQQTMYLLENEEKKESFRLMLEFYGIKVEANDYLIIHKDLLDRSNENFTQPYAFELCEDKSFDEVKNLNDTEYAILVSKNKKFVLKRIYG